MDENLRRSIFPIDWTPQGLRQMRNMLNLTLKEVSDMSGVTSTTVYNIESGITKDPMKVFAYGTMLERWYAYCHGYLPAFRKEGTNEYIEYMEKIM